MSFERQMLFIRARTPSTAGYSLTIQIRLNTDPNLTPNPIRTHDRAVHLTLTDPEAKKTLRSVGVELVT